MTFGSPDTAWMQILVIGVLTLIAVTSVMLGIDKGIRRLSLFNLGGAILLAIIVLIVGPTLIVMQYFAGGLGNYLQTLPQTSFQMFLGDETAQTWQQGWTIFYWGWWISWSPFVGMLIARISYGVTLRKFIAGAILAPALASIFWFSIFGGGGLHLILQGNEAIANADSTSALFTFISALPISGIFATLLSLLSIVVVAVFFATSSDSGSLVVDILTIGGGPNPDWKQRLFWALTEGGIAVILLIAGNAAGGGPLGALQTTAVAAGLPFSFVLVLVCWGLLKALSEEKVSGTEATAPEPGRTATCQAGELASLTGNAAPQKVQQMRAEESERGTNRT